MRKILLAAAAVFVTVGAVGFAQAQSGAEDRAGRHGVLASDANGDGALTRVEFDAGRDAQFGRLDADGNGQLSREEMHTGRGEHRGRRGGHRGGFEGADANNDGNITREEFLARPTQMFERLDANSDGVLSTAERPQRRERSADGGPRRERGDRPIRDSDGNGTISRAEFSAMSAGMFERLDANNDGRVTSEEAQTHRGYRRGRD